MCPMLDQAAIYRAMTVIFHDVFLRDGLVLRPELTAKDVPGWDSFKQIEIIMTIEEKFGIKITTRELDSLQNASDLLRLVVGSP
jgi:acyl carrier protein